jgi:uncharacterized DUF497 family protein
LNAKHPLAGFDWDAGNRDKCRKHGVAIGEIEALFRGDFRVAPDLEHSGEEDRLIAVGRTEEGRAIFVAFTFREVERKILIRPVSARYMHKKEAEGYETEGT